MGWPHYGPEMGGMDPTCFHPKPRPIGKKGEVVVQQMQLQFTMPIFAIGFIHIPEICCNPPNVWHKYQDRIENVALYTSQKYVSNPQNVLHEYQDRMNVWFKLCFSYQYFQKFP